MTRTWNRHARALSLLLGLLVLGCRGQASEDVPESLAPGTPIAREPRRPVAPPPSIPRGLVESDVRVSGFPLPVGVTELSHGQRRYLCLVPANVADTRRYVAQRIITGRVSAVGAGAIYYNSTVREASGGPVRLDISVSITSRGTELEIAELPPPQTRELSARELEEIARREMTEGR